VAKKPPKFYHSSFFTDESVRAPDVETVLGRYKKSVVEHIEAHLKLTLKCMNIPTVTFESLVYAAVYGEYQLVLDGDNAVFRFNNNDITGIYDTTTQLDVTDGIPMIFNNTHPNWFSAEINTTGNGAKFMLPSLGTEVIKLHTFGNQTDLIKKCFVNEVKAFCRHFHDDNSFDLSDMPVAFYDPANETPTEVYDDVMRYLGSTNTAPTPFPDVSPVPLIVLRRILKSADLANNPLNTNLLNTESIANTVRDEYNSGFYSSSEDSTIDIASAIFPKLFSKATANLTEAINRQGATVTLEGNNSGHIRDNLADIHGVDPDEYNYEYRIHPTQIRTNRGTELTYRIYLYNLETDSIEGYDPSNPDGHLYPDVNEIAGGTHERITENQWSMKPTYNEEGSGDATRGKGIPLAPANLVNHRIMLDAFFYMQLYTHLHEKYDTDFDEAANWNETHVKLRYISDLSNTTHRRATVLERHPAVFHPNLTPRQRDNNYHSPPEFKKFYTKKEKRGASLVSVLANRRAYYSLSILSIIRSKSVDKEVMDRVYASSLLKQEVNWLIGAVSDSGKALVEKRVENDPLTRVQYQSVAPPAPPAVERADPPPGPQTRIADALEAIVDRPPVITEFGYSPKRTVFYEVESPLFKDIVSTYSEVFNEFTIMVAYDKEKAKDIKEAELARSIWTSIEKRNTNIFDREDIIPFRLFDILFTQIEEKARQSSLVANIYPDTWAATNNVTLLRTDPVITGQPIEREFYQARLNEFIAHLSRVFKTNHRIPATIVSVIEQAKISSTKDVTALKREFEERLDRDAKLKKLSSTTVKFHAYELMVSILRAYIMIDLDTRNDFVAQRIDETQRQAIRTNLANNETGYVTPPNYPSP